MEKSSINPHSYSCSLWQINWAHLCRGASSSGSGFITYSRLAGKKENQSPFLIFSLLTFTDRIMTVGVWEKSQLDCARVPGGGGTAHREGEPCTPCRPTLRNDNHPPRKAPIVTDCRLVVCVECVRAEMGSFRQQEAVEKVQVKVAQASSTFPPPRPPPPHLCFF